MTNEIKTYSTKETAKILGIKERAVQTRCKNDNIRKKGNKYQITDITIADWRQANAKPNANANAKQLDVEIEALKLENLSLKTKVVELEKEIAELKEELTTYEITENERIEVFTNEEYNKFQKRLIEWRTQQKDSEHQQELFDTKILTLEQSADHYKNSYYYQRKQNEKFINMHEKLLDTIQLNSKEGFVKTVVEAKNTNWSKE